MDIGCYGYVKGNVQMEKKNCLHIHLKIALVLYPYKNNGWRILDLNVNSYNPFD